MADDAFVNTRANQYLATSTKKVPGYSKIDPDMVKTFGMPVKGPQNYEYQFSANGDVWGRKLKVAGGNQEIYSGPRDNKA